MQMACQNLNLLGRDSDVQVIHPLLNATFHAALALLVGRRRDVSRAELLAGVAEERLPRAAYEYRPKAHFSQVFIRRHTREFQTIWDGSGVVETLVDPVALRSVWSPDSFDTTTAMLLQQVWLNHCRQA
jgi:asparagine synthase (glutamine-hydrolysing)